MKFNNREEKRPEKIDDCLVMADKYYEAFPNTIRYCGDIGSFYKYEDGYYQPMNEIAVERYFTLNASGDQFEPINYYKMTKLKQFIRRYAIISEVPRNEFNKEDILNLVNGILCVKTGKFLEHDPIIYSTIRIPYSYNKDADCPSWKAFFMSSLEGDMSRINILQEFMGYCLGRDNSFQKALFLLGEPGAGKGTIIRVIEKLVGRENCAALALGNMGDENSLSNLVDKLINVDADVSISAKEFEADFRRITGGDKLTAKILYRDKFSFHPFCKLILAANELPHIADRTRAFFRRMIVIPFNVSFEGKEDRNLDKKLENEISGILNWALEGRRRLYEQGEFSMGKDLVGYVEEIKRMNNPIELFFTEKIGFHDDKFVTKKLLYETYQKFCKDDGYHALSHAKFSKEFRRWAGPKTNGAARAIFGNREYIWPNVYVRDINEPIEKEVAWPE